jgi:predicted nucleotidyltransferase
MAGMRGGVSARTAAALGEWARRAGCDLLVVFGSAAAGRAHPRSDIDIALLFDPMPEPELRLEMIGQLQDVCGHGRSVDVVFLHRDTDPVLGFEVFRTGVPIHLSGPGRFASEAVRALARYEDALPFRRRLRERLAAGADVR